MPPPPAQDPKPGQLHIKYVRLDFARRWDDNHKIHDLEKIARSIVRRGFRNAPIWDGQLNNGVGGIAGGNGSIEALELLFNRKASLPKFIECDPDDNWWVPIQFGGDSESLAEAEAFALDLNNLTLAGFSAEERSRVWDGKKYLAIVQKLEANNHLPESVDKNDVQRLLAMAKNGGNTAGAYASNEEMDLAKRMLAGTNASNEDNEGRRGDGRSDGSGEERTGTRMTFYVDDPGLVKEAIARTKEINHGEAIAVICGLYLSMVRE